MTAMRRLLRQPLGLVGAVLVLGLVFVAVFGPWLAPYGTTRRDYDPHNLWQPPSAAHPLGTGGQGVDILSRVIMGARVSLFIGFGASLLTVAIGLVFGTIAGYAGGKTDLAIMRLIDVTLAFPSLLLIIILAAAFGQSFVAVFLALALANWAPVARWHRPCKVVRSNVRSTRWPISRPSQASST